MNIRKVDLSATFACVGVLFCWSLGPIFISYLTGYVDSWTQNLLRYSAACLFWLPFLLLSIKRKQIDARIWRKAILPAGANIIFQSLWAGAFYFIGPAFMVLLTKTSVIWIAGFSLIFFPEERPLVKSKRFWSGLALSAMGVIGVMYYKVDLAATNTIIGIFIALATAFMWGVYTVSVRIAFRNTDSRSGFSVISIYTVCCDFGGDVHSVRSCALLRRDEAYRGDYPGTCDIGTAVYRSCDFERRIWRIVKCFSVSLRISFVGRLGPCHLGTAAPEAYYVTRGSQLVK
ncbi:MAG: DMT family transporter [Planctomycetota bacterium]